MTNKKQHRQHRRVSPRRRGGRWVSTENATGATACESINKQKPNPFVLCRENDVLLYRGRVVISAHPNGVDVTQTNASSGRTGHPAQVKRLMLGDLVTQRRPLKRRYGPHHFNMADRSLRFPGSLDQDVTLHQRPGPLSLVLSEQVPPVSECTLLPTGHAIQAGTVPHSRSHLSPVRRFTGPPLDHRAWGLFHARTQKQRIAVVSHRLGVRAEQSRPTHDCSLVSQVVG